MQKFAKTVAEVKAVAKANPEAALILIGPKGVGKSTVGKLAAFELGYKWYDTDHIISEQNNVESIPELYKHVGCYKFRKLEKKALESLDFNPKTIISFGGGAHVYQKSSIYRGDNVIIIALVCLQDLFHFGGFLRVLFAVYHASYLILVKR